MPPRTRKNRDPLAARKLDLEAVNLPADAATLSTQQDIEVTRAGQKRGDQRAREDTARRLDAFAALKEGMVQGAYDAARRYELQLAVRRRESDRGSPTELVNKTAGLVSDASIDAGKWVDAVNDRLAPRDWWLLSELFNPTFDHGGWRGTVAFITGEGNPHAQCAVIRAVAVNLRDASLAADKHIAAMERAATDRRAA